MARKDDSPNRLRKRILIPFWVLQITFSTVIIVPVIVTWSTTSNTDPDYQKNEGVAIYYIFFSAVALLLTVIEPILYCCHKLKHLTYLCFQIAKSIIMLILLVRGIVILALAPPNPTFSVAVIMLVIFLLAFLATLFYASVMYHKHRRSSRYDFIGRDEVHSTNQPQRNSIIATKYDPQDSKPAYEMHPPPDTTTYEALSEPIQEIMTSDNIAELPTTRD